MDRDVLKSYIYKTWADVPAAHLCFKIIDFIYNTPASELEMLTFKSLSNAAGVPKVNSELLAAINILASSSVAALDAKAMFVDDNEEEFELDADELKFVMTTGELFHPETGDLVLDATKKIVPFFVPSPKLLEGHL